jgi:uncharacterized protein involved in cysteine biosynthesis
MGAVVEALLRASRSIVHPIILMIVLVPMVISAAIWVGLAWAYWDVLTSAIREFFASHTLAWTHWNLARLASWITAAAVIAIVAPLIILTALVIATVFAMPVLVRHVAKSHYPMLDRRHGGTVLGSIGNALVAICVFAILWAVTLPLWLLGPLAAILPLLLSAYLNQRLFRYDALAEHASAEEMKQVFERSGGQLFLLGLMTGVLFFVPLLNLLAPIYAALAFIHLCLDELQRMRADGQRAVASA